MKPELIKTETIADRFAEEFQHTADPEWGYNSEKDGQTNNFVVLHPKNEEKGRKYPFFLALHYSGQGYQSAFHSVNEADHADTLKAPTDEAFVAFLDDNCGTSQDYWWGGMNPQNPIVEDRLGVNPTPGENRIIGTLMWCLENYSVDLDRVYGVGVSMGGSGILATALRRGDIFAAVKVGVPAGAITCAERMDFAGKMGEDFKLPDPPPVYEYSAQNDVWSTGHELLLNGMREKKYALVSYWGNFGHDASNTRIPKINDLINTFNIMDIKRNEAYPVFTNCSADDIIPWLDERGMDFAGQVNAYFRWKVLCDTEDKFEIELRIVTAEEIGTTLFTVPDEVTVDVSLRRLQNFKLADGEFIYSYNGEKGKSNCTKGLPTIAGMKITSNPQILTILKR